ncbi:hypothetical protein ACET3X_003159 [Alternaria dauci]|uniref:Uncharacterized protein n=1 Tax=Alternaria dauci TaxID=48095 RepID=A0ABR3US50_9PLEO
MTTTQKDDLVPDPKTATPGKVVNHVQSDDKGTLFGKATIDGCTGKTRENFPPTVFKNNFEKEVLSVEFCNQLCLDAPCDPEGRFLNFEAVLDKLKQAKPGIANWSAKMAMENIENENVANHSKAPLPVAHDLTQPSGLDTPPAESSLTKPILPSSNASGCSRSSPISAHEEKILTTNQVFSQKETVDLPISVERAHKDDGAAVSDEGGADKETPRKSSPQENAASAKATRDYPAEQGSATRSVEESVAQTATTSLVMSSRDTNLDSALSNAGSIDTQSQRLASTSTSIPAKAHTPSPATPDPDEELHKWIYEMYHEIGFQDNGVNFIGHKEFKKRLYALRPNVMQSRIRQAHALLSGPGHKYSFPAVSALQKQKAKARREQQLNAHGSTPTPGTAPTVATQPKDSAQQWPTSQTKYRFQVIANLISLLMQNS